MSEQKEAILKVRGLKTHFDVTKGLFAKKQVVKAVDGISFDVYPNETFGLVGESGCGKSTLGRTIVKLYNPVEGSIEFQGRDILRLRAGELKQFHKDMQMIFQDPYASLNPRMTVGEIIAEPMVIHQMYATNAQREAQVVELLKVVGLRPDHIRRYPHEFSGGQRQRIGIARSLAMNPKFIVCDEPISALDVSIQAQVVNLLGNIKKELGISYLFIAHDLSMVKHISDRIGVMYLGKMAECGPSNDVYHNPLHPYTIALLSAIPVPDPKIAKSRDRIMLEGEIPSPINAPAGCPFSTRCPKATERCMRETPSSVQVGSRQVSCFLYVK